MSTPTEESLQNDIKIVEGITRLAEVVDQATSILARAILELEDPEANHCLRIGTRNALERLAETSTKP